MAEIHRKVSFEFFCIHQSTSRLNKNCGNEDKKQHRELEPLQTILQ